MTIFFFSLVSFACVRAFFFVALPQVLSHAIVFHHVWFFFRLLHSLSLHYQNVANKIYEVLLECVPSMSINERGVNDCKFEMYTQHKYGTLILQNALNSATLKIIRTFHSINKIVKIVSISSFQLGIYVWWYCYSCCRCHVRFTFIWLSWAESGAHATRMFYTVLP